MNTPNVFSYVVFMTFFMMLTHQNEEYELVRNLYSTTFFSEEYGAICYNTT